MKLRTYAQEYFDSWIIIIPVIGTLIISLIIFISGEFFLPKVAIIWKILFLLALFLYFMLFSLVSDVKIAKRINNFDNLF